MASLPVDQTLAGRYRLDKLIGRGGMGAVYEAEDSASGRRVALKVLGHSLDSADTRKRFLREGRLAASINHPNSVFVYGTERRRSERLLRTTGPEPGSGRRRSARRAEPQAPSSGPERIETT